MRMARFSHVIEYRRDITERRKTEDEKRRLIEKLDRLSKTDGLTGMINRRALTDCWPTRSIVQSALTRSWPSSYVMSIILRK
jgi:PleD family two-component response regulator